MTTSFKEYTIDIVDDPNFKPGSADNLFTYDKVYLDDLGLQPTSKHAIRVTKDGQGIASAIVCESGGGSIIHKKSFVVKDSTLFICCCDTVYSFGLPKLTLNWKRELDPATCFGIYSFKDDFIIHGELEIRRIDVDGNTKWDFSARDIFVTQDGTESIKLTEDNIELTDWGGDKYILDEHGQLAN
jgi:hypothetical protein